LECLVVVLVVAIVVAVIPLLAWIAYLLFCCFLVNKTNDPASLKHAAVAARAFRGAAPAALAQALGKVLTLRGR
jgi:hypothetical protein